MRQRAIEANRKKAFGIVMQMQNTFFCRNYIVQSILYAWPGQFSRTDRRDVDRINLEELVTRSLIYPPDDLHIRYS